MPGPHPCFQGFGYGFFFVPTSIIASSQLRPDQQPWYRTDHNRVRTPPTISPDECRFGDRYIIPSNSRCAPKLWRINWSAKVSQARILRLRRKAASFSNSNIKWPARFHGMLPHRCMADLAAIPLLLPVPERISPSNSGGPHCTPRAVRMNDDSSGTGARRGTPFIARRAALSKRQGRVVPGSRLRKPYWKRC